MDLEADIAIAVGLVRKISDIQSDFRIVVGVKHLAGTGRLVDDLTDHGLDDLCGNDILLLKDCCILTVAQDGKTVGKHVDFLKSVRNVDDRNAFAAKCLDDLEQHLRFLTGERSRRLVHDQQLGILRKSLEDLDQLSLSDTQIIHDRSGLQRELVLVDQFLRHLIHLGVINKYALARFSAEEYILCDRQRRDYRKFLIDTCNAELLAVLIAVDLYRISLPENLPVVFRIYARDDLDQRRFTCAVLSHQCMYFSGFDFKADILKNRNAGKALINAFGFNQCISCHYSSPSLAPSSLALRSIRAL